MRGDTLSESASPLSPSVPLFSSLLGVMYMRLRQWPLDHIDIFGSVGRGRGSPHLTPITQQSRRLLQPRNVPGRIIPRCPWHFQTSRPSVKMCQYLCSTALRRCHELPQGFGGTHVFALGFLNRIIGQSHRSLLVELEMNINKHSIMALLLIAACLLTSPFRALALSTS